ncbi:MAG: glycoside hydrolase family 31 protein [Rikenellaceae bacterium]
MKKLNLNRLMGLALLAALSVGCQSEFEYPVVQSQNSVEITHDDLKIRLTVIDEEIIRVEKSPIEEQSYSVPDLVTVLKPQNVEWSLKQTKNKLTIKTDEIKVIINADGTIEYFNKRGKKLVGETNYRTFITPESEENAASQSFTAGDEAIYGLGQFQSGIFNWRGVPMTLRQYNQEVVVPFIVSTNNYGILWNNYSVTDFNPAEHEISFAEADAEIAKQLDYDATNIDVENVVTSKAKIDKEANIRETTFTPDQTGLYTFYVDSDKSGKMRGQIKVTFDDDVVVDYATIWVPMCFSGTKHLEAGREYKVVFQNSGARIPGRLLYNKPDYDQTIFSSHAATSIDYFLLAGDSPAEVIELNHKLTGQAPLLSKKSYGFWQCRERYHDQEELLENANEMRKREIPFDVIVQDWFYWPKGTKGPEWDRQKYPDPEAMVKEVHDLDLNIMVSVWPSVTNDPMLSTYDLVETKLGKTQYLDFWTKSTADGYYKMLSDSMFHFGVNSIWLDGTEPEQKPSDDYQTGMGEFKYLANSYSLVVTKTMYEGRRAEFPRERVVNLSRSSFSGQQRYGAITWSGDVQATWKQFSEQISAGLNFTMSGLPYWSHDIGGFFRDSKSINPRYDSQYTNPEYIELLTRWFQFGAFSPIFRIHGYVSETEIWRYGAEFEAMARKFIDLRYQLMPYIYSEAWKITNDGHVMMSPLAYYYPEDKNTWSIDDQLFFGESIMAAFVTEYEQRQKEVYLPKGEWYDFWTNEKFKGGQHVTVDTPFDQIPLFVKAGSIIPFGPKIQYATQPTTEPTHIRIYPGKDAEYTLYFDDNNSYDYEKGIFSEVEFTFNNSKNKLEIEKGDGKYIDFEANPMTFTIDVMGTDKSYEVTFNGKDLELKL